jgi:hypothetical protein
MSDISSNIYPSPVSVLPDTPSNTNQDNHYAMIQDPPVSKDLIINNNGFIESSIYGTAKIYGNGIIQLDNQS